MVVADDFKEFFIVVGWQTRVWQRHFSKYMVPEEDFMEQAVSKCGVDGGL